MNTAERIVVGAVGLLMIIAVWRAAILALAVARPIRRWLVLYQGWIWLIRYPVSLVARRLSYERADALLAPGASLVMISLVPLWLCVFGLGFGLLFAGLGDMTLSAALRESGSSLFTLGFSVPQGHLPTILTFFAAMTGPLLIGLLISYLPTLYSSFNRRETEVSLLAGRGGDPVWGPAILMRYQWAGTRDELSSLYEGWERLMADIAESHTSYPALVHFRSPDNRRSWITAMMAVMDAAALQLARTPNAAPTSARLVITGGTSAVNSIARTLGLPFADDPMPTDPIDVSFEDFTEAWGILDQAGYPVENDIEQAWKEFRGWRVNWELAAYGIARMVFAPPLRWTGPRHGNPPMLVRRDFRNRRHDDLEGNTLPSRRSDTSGRNGNFKSKEK